MLFFINGLKIKKMIDVDAHRKRLTITGRNIPISKTLNL
jgi:hypothetical protein